MPGPALGMVLPDVWKERTALVFSRRGATLIAVDIAYSQYYVVRSKENAAKLYFFLDKYLREHSGKWAGANRNIASGGLMEAVYNLSRQHAHPGLGLAQFSAVKQRYGNEQTGVHEVSEVDAMQFWKEQRIVIAQRFFKDCRLELKGGARYVSLPGTTTTGFGQFEKTSVSLKHKTGISTAETVKTAANVYNIAEGSSLINKLVGQIALKAVDSSVLAEVLQFLQSSGIISQAVTQFGASVIPIKGLITSGGSALANSILACRDAYRQYDVDSHGAIIDTGTPHAAFVALTRIIEREHDRHVRLAAQSALELGARAASLALDPTHASQAIIGAASAVASLTQRIFLIGRDFLERSRANRILVIDPSKIDANICATHPILGCYLLVGAEMSTIMAFFGNFGNRGWMDDVEAAVKKHLHPLQELAGAYIDDCRFELRRNGLAIYTAPGIWKQLKKWKNGRWDTSPNNGLEAAGQLSNFD